MTEDLVFENQEWVDQTIPENTVVKARLESIELHKFTWPDKRGEIDPATGVTKIHSGANLEWWWEVVDDRNDGLWKGRKVKGQCKPEMNSNSRNRLRGWIEGITGHEIPVGHKVNLQDYVGLTAEITVSHRPDNNDPTIKWERVEDIMPLSANPAVDEPPF